MTGDSQLDQLARQVASLEVMLRSVATGLSADLAALTAGHATLTERLAALEAGPGEASPGGPAGRQPAAWVEVATASGWAELASWVDWLIGCYGVKLDRTILACWPAHPGVAEELAALHTAWRYAALAARTTRDDREMTLWHERALHPTLIRLRQGYAYDQCSRGGHRESKLEHEYTDPAHLQTALRRAGDDPPPELTR